MDSATAADSIPVRSYADLFDIVMGYFPMMVSERLVTKFVKQGEPTTSFSIGVDQINLYACKTPALIGLLKCLGETMEVSVELDTYCAYAYVGGVSDSFAAAGSADLVPCFSPFGRRGRKDRVAFDASEIVAEDLAPFQYFIVMFETRGLGIFTRVLRAVLRCLDEAATAPQQFQIIVVGRSNCSISNHPGFAEELLDEDVMIVQGSGFCVDLTNFYDDSRSIQFNTWAGALRAFRLWRLAYCPCTFSPLGGVGNYVEIGCGDKETCAARDRHWQAKIDLQRAEHDERAHANARARQLWERSQDAAGNARYWRAQAQQAGFPTLYCAQAARFALEADLESDRLADCAARIPEPQDLAPLRLAVEETREAGEAALEAWLNFLPQPDAVDSRVDPVSLAEAEADVSAFASVLERLPEPVALCFKDISVDAGGVFHQYLCELLQNEPVSITKLVNADPESDEEGMYPYDEIRVDESICLIPTRDTAWNGVAPFLHGTKTAAENRQETAEAGCQPKRVCATHAASSAAQDPSHLLLDRRLLRVNGNLISSFMAGAVVSFLPRTGN